MNTKKSNLKVIYKKEIVRTQSGTNNDTAIEQLQEQLKETGGARCMQTVGSTNYVGTVSRPDISHSVASMRSE